MKGMNSRLWLGSVSLALITALVVVDLGRTSPGPLSPSHSLAEGVAEEDCATCHGGMVQTMAEACSACHQVIARQLAAGTGFHGNLESELAVQCSSCHLEHEGEASALVGERAFALAGFPDLAEYDHRGLEFELTGRHLELACADCHERAHATSIQPGEQRFLGLEPRCTSCHQDPHGGLMTSRCADCHGQAQPFGDLDGFTHGSGLVLEGVHGGSACVECHAEASAHSVAGLLGSDPPTARACGDCHESPHRRSFLASVALELGGGEGESCAACHAVSGGGFAEYSTAAAAEHHGASGFPLTAPHAGIECAACHSGGYETNTPPRRPDDCAGCHDDPHGGQFEASLFARDGCLGCHERQRFDPQRFDATQHEVTAFPLVGSHGEAACEACHVVPEPASPRRFAGTPGACLDCHDDAHLGFFESLGDTLSPGEATRCDRCHQPTHFDELLAGAFEHASDTGFALDGAHQRAACEACHPRAMEPDRRGRGFGFVNRHFGTPATDCVTCHGDVHARAATNEAAPVDVERWRRCDRCHSTETFSGVPADRFDHGPWTGFPLDGAHGEIDCASCHRPRSTPDPLGRVFGRVEEVFGGRVESCASCHQDPHRGAFRLAGARGSTTDCAACHDTGSFRAGARESFDHARWTGFSLEGAHAAASCEACHLPSGNAAERLEPVRGSSCYVCHQDPHFGQFALAPGDDCSRCHESSESFTATAFDHQDDSRFPLDERHRSLDCDACHRPWPMRGGGEAIRYRPLGTECTDCHIGSTAGGGRR